MKKNLYSINLAIYNRFQEEMSLGLEDIKGVLNELKQEKVLNFSEKENKIKITFHNLTDVLRTGKISKFSQRTYFLAVKKGNEFTPDLRNWNGESRVYFLNEENQTIDKTNTHLKKLNSKIEQLAERYNQMLEDPSPDDLE